MPQKKVAPKKPAAKAARSSTKSAAATRVTKRPMKRGFGK